MSSPIEPGCLYLVGTPIGNLEDISYRAVRVLGGVDVIAAEDTRHARVLLDHYGITTPTVSYYRENEERRGQLLLERLRGGSSVALISEAGMPGISDPGWRLVARCVEQGVAVDVIPGPSAGVTALLLSGLPCDRFCSLGFLPRSGRARQNAIGELRQQRATAIIYEAPPRVGRTLAELRDHLGERPAALVREMTKRHQEVVRGSLAELAERYADTPPRGEVTLVVGGATEPPEPSPELLEDEVRTRLEQGETPRDVAIALAHHGRRRVYQLALALAQRRQP